MKKPSSKLIHILIGKAIIETILVAAIAVGFNAVAFPPTFHGWGEAQAATRSVAGWAVNDALAWERVEVQLFIDGKFFSDQVAAVSRPDVAHAGWAMDEWHGYMFSDLGLTEGAHEVMVYAVHPSGGRARYTLQLLGDPLMIFVDKNGAWYLPTSRESKTSE
jgi:hypothetical protein